MLLAGFYRDAGQEQKARPFLLGLFEDTSIELSSKLIVLGAYNAELNENKARKLSDPDKESFALVSSRSLRIHIPATPAFMSSAATSTCARGRTGRRKANT